VTSAPAGVNCTADCTASFDSGTVVTLTATPLSPAFFQGWSGDCVSDPCTVTMSAARSVTAFFVVITIQ
jgi:hypothetical protein